jgi:hypothetical protein
MRFWVSLLMSPRKAMRLDVVVAGEEVEDVEVKMEDALRPTRLLTAKVLTSVITSAISIHTPLSTEGRSSMKRR